MKIKDVCQFIFSVKNENIHHKVLTIFGIRFKFVRKKFADQYKKYIKIQNKYNLLPLKKTEKLIVFLIPPVNGINGGIMSIFSLCETTRTIVKDAMCLIATYPGKMTYARNDNFINDEQIYRWEQIINIPKQLKSLILHIPEYYVKEFYTDLTDKEIEFLNKIPDLQINIMNQNIELMPEPETLREIESLTKNITQTIAHNRYATQEVCEKWKIPTHLFSVNVPIDKYKSYPFEEKEKIIVLSPDENEYKAGIVNKLANELPDFRLITVQNMKFSEYMDLISRAYFTITFGEGFDGYFSQPVRVGSVSFAVYNDNFFPDKSWNDLDNVFSSYQEMEENIVQKMQELLRNKELYYSIAKTTAEKRNMLYSVDKFKNNLERYYNKDYDFLPKK